MALYATKTRAQSQAHATIETKIGRVTKAYKDSSGNINGGDVVIQGETTTLKNLPNASGGKFRVGDNVTVNFPRGQPLAGQIVSFAGGNASSAQQSGAAATTPATTTSEVPVDASQLPLLLQGLDNSCTMAYVELPGSNVVFVDLDPGTITGQVNGSHTVSAVPTLATTSLPNPTTTTLPDKTVLDLMDSSNNSLGMYRLDLTASPAVWRRRDAGGAPTIKDISTTNSYTGTTEIDFGMPTTQPSSGHVQVLPVYQQSTAPPNPVGGMLWDDGSTSPSTSSFVQVDLSATTYTLNDTEDYIRFIGTSACTIYLTATYPLKKTLRIKNDSYFGGSGSATLTLAAAPSSSVLIESGGSSNTVVLMPGSSTSFGGALTLLRTGSHYNGV